MDNDAKMLQLLSNSLTQLEVKYRATNDFATQQELEPQIEELVSKYSDLRRKLREGPVIMTEQDIAGMTQIRDEIDRAADKQSMLLAIARTVAFIGLRL
jgi:hypothetical protein